MKKRKILLCMIIMCICLFASAESQVKATEMTERQVTAIELPQNLNFYLDPENENGRGQIYSDKYRIRNAGKEAVYFSIDITLLPVDEQASITFCPEEWETEPVDRSIYMYAVFEGKQREDVYVLTDTENSCMEEIVLEPAGEDGDTVCISFGGRLSQSEDWKSGELAINALYTMSAKGAEYQAKVEGKHIKIENEDKLEAGENAELYLVPDEGYSLPAKIQVYMSEVETAFAYDMVTGKVSLDNVAGDVVIYADGIAKASLPDEELMDMGEMLWSWSAQEGIQAYEYIFLKEDREVSSGRISVEDGMLIWNWSEGLEDGDYQLHLKAIGDSIHCMNSEEGIYSITVDREILQPSESPEEDDKKARQTPGSIGEGVTPQPIVSPENVVEEPTGSPESTPEGETHQPIVSPGDSDEELIAPSEGAEEGETPQPTASAEEGNEEPTDPSEVMEESETPQLTAGPENSDEESAQLSENINMVKGE